MSKTKTRTTKTTKTKRETPEPNAPEIGAEVRLHTPGEVVGIAARAAYGLVTLPREGITNARAALALSITKGRQELAVSLTWHEANAILDALGGAARLAWPEVRRRR